MYKEVTKKTQEFMSKHEVDLKLRAVLIEKLISLGFDDIKNKETLKGEIAAILLKDSIFEEPFITVTKKELEELLESVLSCITVIECPIKVDDTVYYVAKIDGEYKCLPCNVRLIRHIQSDNTNKPSFEALLACKDESIKLTDSEEYKIGKMFLGEKDNIVWINKIMFNQVWFIDEKEAMTKLYELTK